MSLPILLLPLRADFDYNALRRGAYRSNFSEVL